KPAGPNSRSVKRSPVLGPWMATAHRDPVGNLENQIDLSAAAKENRQTRRRPGQAAHLHPPHFFKSKLPGIQKAMHDLPAIEPQPVNDTILRLKNLAAILIGRGNHERLPKHRHPAPRGRFPWKDIQPPRSAKAADE